VGIAGLGAGVEYLLERGVDQIRAHEIALTRRLLEGLGCLARVKVYGPPDPNLRTATVSFTVAGRRVSDLGMRLDEEFDIFCRVGLHCAPAAHRTIGTFPEGTVRLSAGSMTTLAEIDTALAAVEQIVK
jgi:selenocysteine lyase/cysteine desulfurase